jgi:integrase/recombinase XerD
MTPDPSTTSLVVYDPVFADPECMALAGYLAGYRGLTCDAYPLDLRQFVAFRE